MVRRDRFFKLPSALADGFQINQLWGFSPISSAKAGKIGTSIPLAKANGNLKCQCDTVIVLTYSI
jgi:hypothetical protein